MTFSQAPVIRKCRVLFADPNMRGDTEIAERSLWGPELLHNEICIEFAGVTLVHTATRVSGVQLCDTRSVHCAVCSPPRVRSPPSPLTSLHAPPSPSPFVSVVTTPSPGPVQFILLGPFSRLTQPSLPSDSCWSVLRIRGSVSTLLCAHVHKYAPVCRHTCACVHGCMHVHA